MKPNKLEVLRGKIKEKDQEIIRLLNERSRISVEIGKVKGEGGIQVYDPAQEARVHAYLRELNTGPLPNRALTAIFREIISASRDLQRPTTVAFLGRKRRFRTSRRARISAIPAAIFRRPASGACSMRWKRTPSTGAWCPWKILWRDRSTRRSTD